MNITGVEGAKDLPKGTIRAPQFVSTIIIFWNFLDD
jgi:hypothetical protein